MTVARPEGRRRVEARLGLGLAGKRHRYLEVTPSCYLGRPVNYTIS